MEFNHDRTIEDFEEQLKLITDRGYSPIGVSQMLFEDVFIFETDEEAEKAFQDLEFNNNNPSLAIGWWYGKEEFLKEALDYEKCHDGTKVKVLWIE